MYIQMYIFPMSKRYTLAEARANLPTILDEIETGADVELTRRGKPVAVVMSVRECDRLRGRQVHFKDAYALFMEQQRPGIDKGFPAKLRDRSPGRNVAL
jgi:prevent-host-death family protein